MKFLKHLLTEYGRYRETEKDRRKREEMEHELGHETEENGYGGGQRRPGSGGPGYARKHRFDTAEEDRRYLKVPYAEKEEAKRHKLKWSPEKKMWYHSAGWSSDAAFKLWDEVK